MISSAIVRAIRILKRFSGTIRTAEVKKAGIHSRTIKRLVENGTLEKLSRGVYRLTERGDVSFSDLVIVASRIPQAIVCLSSALAFHEITTQIPHEVSIALSKGARTPRIDFPPITAHRFAEETLKIGVEEHNIDGVRVKIYCSEKAIADCFKFRNKIGMDIVLEALKLYKLRKKFDLQKLLKYAKICRVEKIMMPYLEALL